LTELHESWLLLVYGPSKRKPRVRQVRNPGLTDPIERTRVPFPRKRKWFHEYRPPLTVNLHAERHEVDAEFEQYRKIGEPPRRQRPRPKKLFLRVSGLVLKEMK